MTRRRDLENHRRSLEEIRDIMNSMKNLSYMETRKLGNFLDVQHAVVNSITEAAEDFLGFYPDTLSEAETADPEVCVLIGAERGFCGDFNNALLRELENTPDEQGQAQPQLIAVGHKLHGLLQDDKRVVAFIDGASVAEEVDSVLGQLVSQLAVIQQHYAALNLSVLHYADEHELVRQTLLPPFQHLLHRPPRYSHAPQLNLSPANFFLELSTQYLFAALHEILYTSLMAENRRRVAHLDGAVRHMEEQSEQLRHQGNVLRQEEIIEEIEVILLSAVGVGEQ